MKFIDSGLVRGILVVLDDIENLLGFSVIFGILLSDELSLNGVPKEELEKEISKKRKIQEGGLSSGEGVRD